jgi:hypothetical protein
MECIGAGEIAGKGRLIREIWLCWLALGTRGQSECSIILT